MTPLERANQIRDGLVVRMHPHTPERDAMAYEMLPPGAIVLTADEAAQVLRFVQKFDVVSDWQHLLALLTQEPA